MDLTFRKDEGMAVVEAQGNLTPPDRDRVQAEIARHVDAGVRAFLIDTRRVGLGYPDSHGYFLEAWRPALKSGRVRVAFLVPRRDEKQSLFRRLWKNVVGANERIDQYWLTLGSMGVINVFDNPEEAKAFLRTDSTMSP